jgi:inorganic pyrophosphatase
MEFDVIVEISQGESRIKYELDLNLNLMRVDRFLNCAMFYPANYGFIPNSEGADKDPLDVLIIAPYPINIHTIIKCRLLGGLEMSDEKGEDNKIISVPADDVLPSYGKFLTIEDLPEDLLFSIRHFFLHYKDLSPSGHMVIIGEWLSYQETREYIKKNLK